MRNRYGGDCYRCGLWVPPGAGYFEKVRGGPGGPGWRVQHCYRTHNGGITCEMARARQCRETPGADAAPFDRIDEEL